MASTPRFPGGLLTILLLPCAAVTAEPEIHRCPQADGTIAFQEMPCPETPVKPDEDAEDDDVPPTSADAFWEFSNPFDETTDPPPPADPAPSGPVSRDRADCEKTTRDAIDAIDLEMRKGYSKEQGERYFAELLELTQPLRACKQL